MTATRDFLRSIGLPPGDLNELPDSDKRFPDGAQYRDRDPEHRGPALPRGRARGGRAARRPRPSRLAGQRRLPAHRRGARRDGAHRRCRTRRGLAVHAPERGLGHVGDGPLAAGAVVAPAAHGQEQVVACLDDARRAADHGFRSVLIADLGVLSAFTAHEAAGELPADMQAKISVMLPAANPAAARVLERARREHDQPADRPLARADRGDPRRRRLSRWTSTSRRPTTSAGSSACTRSPS